MTVPSTLVTLTLVTALTVAIGGCRRGAENNAGGIAPTATFSTPTEAGTARPSTPLDLADAATAAKADGAANGEAGEPLGEPIAAVLTAEDAQAEINLRSQPTVDADIVGYGLVGDRVTLLRSIEAADGYGWYFLSFDESGAEGWIRGDFIDTRAPQSSQPGNDAESEDALAEALDGGCGGPQNISHYYSTVNYNIYICQVRGQAIYVGNEKGTPQVLLSEEVTAVRGTDGGYVATNGNFEYHISPTELVVYRIDDAGDYTQILQESVTAAETY